MTFTHSHTFPRIMEVLGLKVIKKKKDVKLKSYLDATQKMCRWFHPDEKRNE